MPVLQLSTQKLQMAWQSICAIGADLKCVMSGDLHVPARVTSKSKLRASYRFVQQLQVAALCKLAADVDGDFTLGDAVQPEPCKRG